MATKFQQFLKDGKVDARRLLAASTLTERQRAVAAAAKPAEGEAAKGDAAKKSKKRLRGRPITERLLSSALEGKAISGPAKTRLLRAVNYVLVQKKQKEVDLRALF